MLFLNYDLNIFFDDKNYELLNIGDVSFPTGEIVVCDAMCNLGIKNNMLKSFINKVDPGNYPVTISVAKSGIYKDKYIASKVSFNEKVPVQFEVAIKYGDVLKDLKQDETYGFNVESKLACFCDKQVEELYECYLNEWYEKNVHKHHYEDYFSLLFNENYDKNPKHNYKGCNWINWTLPDTDFTIPIFTSGMGDGFYSCYWGLDKYDDVCDLTIQFIDPYRLS